MAIALDAVGPGATAATAPWTENPYLEWTHVVGSGADRLIIVCVGWDAGGGPPAISSVIYDYGGANTAMTLWWADAAYLTYYRQAAYYLVAPASGTKTIRVTLAGTPDAISGASVSYTGVDQTTPVDTPVTLATGINTSFSTNAVTSAAGDLVVGMAYCEWDTIATSDTNRSEVEASANCSFCLAESPGAASVTLDFSGTPSSAYGGKAGNVNAAAAGGGSAHPYTGSVGVGAKTAGAQTVRTRGIVRVGGGAQAYSAYTVKARGKAPTVGASQSYSASTNKARGKSPVVGGSQAFTAAAVYSKATLYLFTSGASQAYSAGSIYSKEAGAAGTAHSYVGQGVLVFSGGHTRVIGRVYEGGGALHFSGGTIVTRTKAYGYTGLGSGSIVYLDATVYSYESGVESDLEAKPPTRSATHEALPGRPVGQDGFFAEPGQDGFYDEYPVHGFYADIGYYKEMKPFHRATMTKEGKPS